MNRIKGCFFCMMLVFVLHAGAQRFTHFAEVERPVKSGMYQVVLIPDLRAHAATDFHDLRLVDELKGNEVPYALVAVPLKTTETYFNAYQYADVASGRMSTFVIVRDGNSPIDRMVLKVANTRVSKRYVLSGSDDLKRWYALLPEQTLQDMNAAGSTWTEKTIYFPKSSYRYLRLILNDSTTSPVRVLKIGNYETDENMSAYLQVPGIMYTMSNDPNTHVTRIFFYSANRQVLNRMHFFISRPAQYLRKAELSGRRRVKSRGKEYVSDYLLTRFDLRSDRPLQFDVGELYEDTLLLTIENANDAPLSVDSILFSQKPLSLIARVNAGQRLRIMMGDRQLAQPAYDIVHFTGDTPWLFPELRAGALQAIDMGQAWEENKAISFWQKPWFMWLCIGTVVTGLFVFSINLVKELRKGG